TVPRDRDDPARAAGPSLYGGRPPRAGAAVLARRRAPGPPALGQRGSGPAFVARAGAACHPPCDPRAGTAGDRHAAGPGAGARRHPGAWDARRGADLRPRPGVVRAGGGDAPAPPGAAGVMLVLY